jgi:hypothetical protein
MWHSPTFTLEIDCRASQPPQLWQTFTLSVVRDERFEVIHVAAYPKPQRRPDGTTATHHIRYRRAP